MTWGANKISRISVQPFCFKNAYKRISLVKRVGWVRLGEVMLMRSGSSVMASSSSHLATLSTSHQGITECKTSECMNLEQWHIAWGSYKVSRISVQPFGRFFYLCKRTSVVKRVVWIGWGWLVMRMRSGSCVTASSFHLATLSIRHEGKTGCKTSQCMNLE
jgi:hypothetical protein